MIDRGDLSAKNSDYVHRILVSSPSPLSPLDNYVRLNLTEQRESSPITNRKITQLKQSYRNEQGRIAEDIHARLLDDYGLAYSQDQKRKGEKRPDFLIQSSISDFPVAVEVKNLAGYYQISPSTFEANFMGKFRGFGDSRKILVTSFLRVSPRLREKIEPFLEVFEFGKQVLKQELYESPFLDPEIRENSLPDTAKNLCLFRNWLLRNLRKLGIIPCGRMLRKEEDGEPILDEESAILVSPLTEIHRFAFRFLVRGGILRFLNGLRVDTRFTSSSSAVSSSRDKARSVIQLLISVWGMRTCLIWWRWIGP